MQCHGVTFKLAVPVTVTVRCHPWQTVTNWQRLHWQPECFGVQVGCASLSHGDRRAVTVRCHWHGATVFKLAAVPVTVPVTVRLTRKLVPVRCRLVTSHWHAAGGPASCQCQWP